MDFITTEELAKELGVTRQAIKAKIDKNDIFVFRTKNKERYNYHIPKDYYIFPNQNSNECKIIAINNLKGGVGKTTLATNLSTILSKLNKKVLLVDMDPQSNTTAVFTNPNEVELSMKELFDMFSSREVLNEDIIKEKIKNTIQNIELDNYTIDLLPSKLLLAKSIDYLRTISTTAVFKLDNILKLIKNEYDYIIIDTPPNASIIMQMCLYATDEIIAVTLPEEFAIYSMEELFNEIDAIQFEVQGYKGKPIKINSIIINSVQNLVVHKASIDAINDIAEIKRINNIYEIPRSAKVIESQALKTPLIDYKDELVAGGKCIEPILKLAIDIIKD